MAAELSREERLVRADPLFAGIVASAGPCPLKAQRGFEPFHALARSIAFQQLSGKAAATIFGRVCALFPDRKQLDPAEVLAVEETALRAAGLSGAKTAAFKDLSAKALEGIVPTRRKLATLSDDEIIARLSSVRGIGRWTVEMLLIFDLGREDVLPTTDLGVRKGFARLQHVENLPTPSALLAYGARWQPWRSLAAWYLWRAAETPGARQS